MMRNNNNSSGSSSSNNNNLSVANSSVPNDWLKVLGILNEAQLPSTLPVRWPSTQNAHEKIVFDPQTGKQIDVNKIPYVETTPREPVRFIMLSNNTSVPGTSVPAAVRAHRYAEMEQQGVLSKDAGGNVLAPCIAHGEYVKVESLQADHIQAKENIKKRQKQLVDKLNAEPDFANFLMAQPGMEKFFIKIKYDNKEQYFGTLFFYELYLNDIDNIWLICQACNLQKSADDTIDWLSKQWLYSTEFLDYLALEKQDDPIILKKASNQKGLAEVAIAWFWQRHASYLSTAKRLNDKIVVPVQILNRKIDHLIGIEKHSRAERLQASLNFKSGLAQAMVSASGLEMPKREEESDTSSDPGNYLFIEDDTEVGTNAIKKRKAVPLKIYQEAAEKTIEEAPTVIANIMKSNVSSIMKAKNDKTNQI